MTPNTIIDTKVTPQDKSLLTFMASSSRELTIDANISPLAAFDILQKTKKRFATQWWMIWIVCMDGFADITPTLPLQEAVDKIEKHGGAAGLVGLAVVAGTFRFLKKPLQKGKKVQALLEKSGNAAADRFLELTEKMLADGTLLRP
jgi:hypothetical protein